MPPQPPIAIPDGIPTAKDGKVPFPQGLELNRVNPYYYCFTKPKKAGEEQQYYTKNEQLDLMLQHLDVLLDNNPDLHIGLTYAANNKQTLGLDKVEKEGYTYEKLQEENLHIEGGGQAPVFELLQQKIMNSAADSKYKRIHILPITTAMHLAEITPEEKRRLQENLVKNDMENIAKRVGEGWLVLGPTVDSNHYKLAVGGRNATGWQDDLTKEEKTPGSTEPTKVNFPSFKKRVDSVITQLQEGKFTNPTMPGATTWEINKAYQEGLKKRESLSPTPPKEKLDTLTQEWPPKHEEVIEPEGAGFTLALVHQVFQDDKNFKVEHNSEQAAIYDSNPDEKYISSITKDGKNLANVTNKKINCVSHDDAETKSDQAEVVVRLLEALARNKQSTSAKPLNVKVNPRFSEELLQQIVTNLSSKGIAINFLDENLSPQHKNIVDNYNKQLVKPSDPAAPSVPLPPSVQPPMQPPQSVQPDKGEHSAAPLEMPKPATPTTPSIPDDPGLIPPPSSLPPGTSLIPAAPDSPPVTPVSSGRRSSHRG